MMGKSLALGIVIGGGLSASFNQSFKTAKDKASALGDALRKTGNQKNAIKHFKQLEIRLGKTATSMRSAQALTAKLGREIAATTNPTKKLRKEFDRARIKSDALKNAHRKQKNELSTLRGELRGAGIDTRKLVAAEKILGRQMDATRRKLEHLNKAQAAKGRLASLKGRALGAAGALYGAGRLIGKSIDLEQAQVRLSTVVNTKDLGKSLAQSKRHALDFARNNLASETEILNIEYALNSADLGESASRLGSEIVAKVATITGGASAQVGEVIATTFKNLGDSLEGSTAEKLKRIGELLTKTQFKFQIRDFGQLGESMKIGATVMNQYNIALDQGVTLLGALNSAGFQGSQAGTSLAATMRSMSKASREYGFELVRNDKGQLDVIATLKGLSDAIGGFEEITTETSDALQKTFGDDGIRGVIALGKQVDKLAASQQDVAQGSKGLIDKSYNRFLHSTGGQVKVFGNNMRILGEVITGTLLPAVNMILTPMTYVVKWLGKAVEEFPVLGKIMGGIVVGFVGYAAILGGVTAWQWAWNTSLAASQAGLAKTAVSAIWAGTVYAASAIKMGALTAAQWALNIAMGANPVGAVILGVAALATGAYVLYNNWDSVTKWFGDKLDWLTDKFSFIGDAWHSIFGDEEKTITQRIKQTAEPIKNPAVAAAMAATMAAVPAHAVGNPSTTETHNSYQITIHAQPGQDAAKNAEDMMREIERIEASRNRSAMHNRESDL